ncbi:MAG: hypothetical protein NVS9B15_10790 [Acidobacteriaceae bacterium]
MGTATLSAVPKPTLKQLTPVMIVEEVEKCLPFWTERFGFAVENSVPGPDGKLMFASAKSPGGAIEIMYQTRASVVADEPSVEKDLNGHSVALFIVVDNFDAAEAACAGVEVLKARHTTFYGSTEMYVREPGGNTVGFAHFG